MSKNKNALLRYHTIDRCLRNTGRRWTLDDLVEACSDALYEYEGKLDPVSRRTVQLDLQMMRSDRLGYEAPIEVYDRKYYRYSDPDYSICNRPVSEADIAVLNRAVDLLRQFDEFDSYHELAEVVSRMQDKIASVRGERSPIVDFERNPDLKGLRFLRPLYSFIADRTTVCVTYKSFKSRHPHEFTLYPHLLKEYRNRWFLFGSRTGDMTVINLALDRMAGIRPCPEIPYRDNPEFGPGYFSDMVGVTRLGDGRPEQIRILADRPQAAYILTKPLHHSQQVIRRNEADGSVEISIKVSVNQELIALLLSFGPGIRVLSPATLVGRMSAMYRRAAAIYVISEEP